MNSEEEREPLPEMQSALAIVRGEHQGFAMALHALERYLKPVVEHGLKPNHDLFETILAYIDTFMDRFHHPKEDEHLFRAIRDRTDRADAALLELQHEHAVGPALLREVRESLGRTRSGGRPEVEAFALRLHDYVGMQDAHMRTENEVVMPIAREVLLPEDWKAIDGEFRENRDPLFGGGNRSTIGWLFR